MGKMNNLNHSDRKYIILLSSLLLICFILIEFILPPNIILPKPSIVVLSIISLFRDYYFWVNILSSVSAIYLSAIIAGLFVWILKSYLFNKKKILGYFALSLKWISGKVPGILMGLILILWLPESEISKYIFIFFACFISLYRTIEEELKGVNEEYIDAVASLKIYI